MRSVSSVRTTEAVAEALAERFACQTFVVPEVLVRLMCGWDTTPEDIDAVVDAVMQTDH